MSYSSVLGTARAHWAVLLAVTLAGCSGSGAAPGTVSVSGLITLDGKPISGAAVAFIGNDGARLSTAQTDPAGKFSIRAALGKNVVTVAKIAPGGPAPPPSDEPQLMPSEGEYKVMQQAIKSEVPAKYGDPKTSGLSVEVKAGMPLIELDLAAK
jgi:hypothetical protein